MLMQCVRLCSLSVLDCRFCLEQLSGWRQRGEGGRGEGEGGGRHQLEETGLTSGVNPPSHQHRSQTLTDLQISIFNFVWRVLSHQVAQFAPFPLKSKAQRSSPPPLPPPPGGESNSFQGFMKMKMLLCLKYSKN